MKKYTAVKVSLPYRFYFLRLCCFQAKRQPILQPSNHALNPFHKYVREKPLNPSRFDFPAEVCGFLQGSI